MAHDAAVTAALRQANRLHSLTDGSDLVRLYQNRVGDTAVYPFSQDFLIRYKEIVPHELDFIS